MYTVMIAGGLGSGKSTLTRILCEHGATSFDTDEIGHAILEEDTQAKEELLDYFGDIILNEDNSINRATLAELAFGSPQSLKALNDIMLPRIIEQASGYILNIHCVPLSNAPVMVLEVPLLSQVSDFAKLADERLAVVAQYETRLMRAMKRGMSRLDAQARMDMQATDDELRKIVDTVCENNGTLEQLQDWAKGWWNTHIKAKDWENPW